MKDFVFWRTETIGYRTHFQAESLEVAEKQLERIINGEIDVTDLPEHESIDKHWEQEICSEMLEEIL